MRTSGDNSGSIDSRHRVLFILWIAFLISIGFLAGLTIFMGLSMRPRLENPVMSWTLTAIGACAALVSFVPKRKLLNQAIEKQAPVLVVNAYVVAFSLSEAAGILGLLLFFLTPGRTYISLFVISIVVMFAHYPRRTDLMAASFKM